MSVTAQEIYSVLQASDGVKSVLDQAIRSRPLDLTLNWQRGDQFVSFDLSEAIVDPRLFHELLALIEGSGDSETMHLFDLYEQMVLNNQVTSTGHSNHQDDTRKEIHDYILKSMTESRFNAELKHRKAVAGFTSYQDFLAAQSKYVDYVDERGFDIFNTLMGAVIPGSSYLDDVTHSERKLSGLIFDKDGRIIFV